MRKGRRPAGNVDPGVAVVAALAVDRVSNDVVRHVVDLVAHWQHARGAVGHSTIIFISMSFALLRWDHAFQGYV